MRCVSRGLRPTGEPLLLPASMTFPPFSSNIMDKILYNHMPEAVICQAENLRNRGFSFEKESTKQMPF